MTTLMEKLVETNFKDQFKPIDSDEYRTRIEKEFGKTPEELEEMVLDALKRTWGSIATDFFQSINAGVPKSRQNWDISGKGVGEVVGDLVLFNGNLIAEKYWNVIGYDGHQRLLKKAFPWNESYTY